MKHAKEISRKKKSDKEYNDQYCEYAKFLLDNVYKVKEYKESPHIIISRSYKLIEDNSIELVNPIIENETQHERKFFYKVGKNGKSVKMSTKRNKLSNLLLDQTKKKTSVHSCSLARG